AAYRLGLFASTAFRRLFVAAPQLHFSEHPLALHFFLQGPEGLINIIVANEDLHGGDAPSEGWLRSRLQSSFNTCGVSCEGAGTADRACALPGLPQPPYCGHGALENRPDG